MLFKNRCLIGVFCLALFFPVVAFSADDEPEPTEPKEVTDKIKDICAKADERYKKIMGGSTDEPGVVIVKLYKYTFCPPNIEIKKGTTVRWVNVDRRTSHSVWLKQAGKEESERFFPEELWSYTFNEPGKFPYLCGPHWKQEKMYGHVTVTP